MTEPAASAGGCKRIGPAYSDAEARVTSPPIPSGSPGPIRSQPPVRHRPADTIIEAAWLGGLLASLTALAFLFPPNGDDWAGGSRIGLNRGDHLFAGYNGRYAGDVIVIVLTRLHIIAPFVISASVTAIAFLTLDITANRTRWGSSPWAWCIGDLSS